MMKKTILLGGALALIAGSAYADYPVRPVQLVVPYSAGGGTDLSMRLLADALVRQLDGARFVVRNQPGGGGTIGTSAAIHARPDGYTLGAGAQGPLSLQPHLGGTDYDLDDVEFIALFGRNIQLMVGCANAPFADLEEFLSYGRDNKIQVGNSGAGGANHISAEAFARAANIQIESIPYPGAADARTACVGGHVQAIVASPSEALSASQAGQMNPIFVMEEERLDLFPDTPTAIEHGIDFTWSSWKGLIGPKGLPEEVLKTLNAAVTAAIEDPDFRQAMEDMGEFIVYEDAATYAERARRDSEVAARTIEELGMTGINN